MSHQFWSRRAKTAHFYCIKNCWKIILSTFGSIQ